MRSFMVIKVIILLTLDNKFYNVYCFDDQLFAVLNQIIQHSDINYISDNIENVMHPNSNRGENFIMRHQLSFVQTASFDLQALITKLHPEKDFMSKLIISDKNATLAFDIVKKVSESKVFFENKKLFWIIILLPRGLTLEDENLKIELSNLSENFTIDTHFYFAFVPPISSNADPESELELKIFESYSINKVVVFKEVEFGKMVGECLHECDGQPLKRHDFNGISLRCEGVDDPYNDDTLFGNETNGRVNFTDGFSVKVLDIMKDFANFTIIPMKSNQWGARDANGTWIGVVKDIADGLVDIGFSLTVMLPSRATLVAFLPPTDSHIVSAFFKIRTYNSIREIFFVPFKLDLWAAVVSTWFILAFTMILFTTIRRRYGIIGEKESDEPDFTHDSFIWALATACQQGWDEHPQAGSLRTIFISGSFTGVVAYAGYSAAIVSTLSQKIDPIKTPQSLLESNLRLGMRMGFFNELLAQNTTEDIISRAYRRLSKRDDEKMTNVTQGYENLEQRPFAFISFRNYVYDTAKMLRTQEEICQIKELPLLKQRFPAGPVVPKKSPYIEALKHIIMIIRERGILWKLQNNYTMTRRCLESSDNSGRALGSNDVFSAFAILFAGYIVSLSIALIEKMVSSTKIIYMK